MVTEAWNLTKNELHHTCFDIFCRKFPAQLFLREPTNRTFDSLFNGRDLLRQLTDLTFKWRELIKMMLPLLAIREIFPFQF